MAPIQFQLASPFNLNQLQNIQAAAAATQQQQPIAQAALGFSGNPHAAQAIDPTAMAKFNPVAPSYGPNELVNTRAFNGQTHQAGTGLNFVA